MTAQSQRGTNVKHLVGRTALVTGSTSGIGAATAQALAAQGATVIVSGRNKTRGRDVVESIRAAGGQAQFLTVDLRDSDAVRDFASRAADALGGHVDVLVNNAGIYPSPPTIELTDDDLDAMLAVNVRAPHILVAQLVLGMIEQKHGVIVNIGSWMARVGSPMAAMYSATKAAIEQLTRAWSAEFGPSGLKVITVSPGVTLTPGNASAEEALQQMAASTPAGVIVPSEDVAQAIVFASSDDARMINGTIIDIDGGMSATRL